ncbi:uncharacterized protein F5891DRAFT_987180 [Suillus fuscotomentosus]|uniref:Uncharacterized protein n=1 Tax=Suillus fuscotomentosus TaxID=1912939 RepID=A0AAD4DQR0_9AGAM|nr:uncharacterized protein F5891DRAFT_987180 [Suillus fuscotomentosus]KAG1840985.1 hypothetical protein C8R48DRAFT_679424 [Suillus tomentosus]KAG1889789.1 hypothetical protein F5891DRAFT_987180 [Suillus fuscotomentosus]
MAGFLHQTHTNEDGKSTISKLRTELYILYFLLKGRVYHGDIWQIIGGRILEAQTEESLRTVKDNKGRVTVERAFMEQKRDRCQLEMSLCSQAIDHVQQRWIMREILPTTQTNVSTEACSTSIGAYSAAVQHKCETWLREQDPDFTPVRQLFSDKYGYSNCITHIEQRMPVIVHSIDSSFHLSSTWVPPGVQEAFDKACHLELRSQTGLVATYLDMEGYHSHQRNPELELYHLHVKMCRAKAEVEVYELAIGNAPASDYSDSDASSSLGSRP